MNAKNNNDILAWRYATKQFDPKKKLSQEDLNEILETLRFSPSSYGLQPWKFIVISDQVIRAKLKENAWNQPQITDASQLIVLCARTDVDSKHVHSFVEEIAKTRGVTVASLKAYEEMMNGTIAKMTREQVLEWSKKQVYLALGFLLHACAVKKIDACPMEGFDSIKFDEILGLDKEHLTSAVICPVGYRSADDKYALAKKVRFDEKRIIIKK